MPEITLYADREEDTGVVTAVTRRFTSLENAKDAVFITLSCYPHFQKHGYAPFVRIEASIDMTDEELIRIADHFNKIIDVSIRFSWGPMVFREKDVGFGNAITEAKSKMHDILATSDSY